MNDAQFIQKAVDMLVAMTAAIRNIRLYPAGSPLVAGSVAKIHPILTEMLAARGKMSFGESEKVLLISGRSLPEKDAKRPQAQAFLELMAELEIKSLDFEPGVTPEEIESLLDLMSRKSSEIASKGGIQTAARQAALDHVHLDQKVYVAVDKGREQLVASVAERSESDIMSFLEGGADAPAANPDRLRQLVAAPEELSRVFDAGIAQLKDADAHESHTAVENFSRLLTGLSEALHGEERSRILGDAASALAQADPRQILAVLGRSAGELADGGMVEALVNDLDSERFEALAVRARRTARSKGEGGDTTDLYERIMDTDQGKAAKERIENRFRSEESQRQGQMSRLKTAMDQLLHGRVEALADPEIVRAMPATVDKLLEKGKAQTADTLIQALLARLLESPSREERTRIIDAVTATGPAALGVVTRQITPEAPWYYLRNLILLLGRLGTQDHLPRLTPMLTHDDFRIQREAFNALYQIGGDRRGDLLLSSLDAAKDPTKILIVAMLGKLRHAPAQPALADLLHASRGIAQAAVRDRLQEKICAALAHLGDPRALPALNRVAEAPADNLPPFAPGVCEAAQKAASALQARTKPPASADDIALNEPKPAESAVSDSVAEEIDRHVAAGDTDAAVRTLFDAIVAAAKKKDFARAEALHKRLYDVDAMALTEIVKAGEIIEAEKSEALDRDHLDLWPELYASLTDEEANALFFAMKEQVFEPNDVILAQGKANDALYFINQGQLKSVFRQENRETLLCTVDKGEVVGNRTFFSISVCTISVIAQTRVKASVLHRGVLSQWQQEVPALESKLKNYCLTLTKTEDLLKKKGVDRRTQKRVPIQGKTRIQMISAAGRPAGKPFRGELADLSVGGVAFLIRSSKEETVRLLLGRRIHIAFKIRVKSEVTDIDRDASIIGIHYLQQNEYSLHARFEAEIDASLIEELAGPGPE